MLKIITDNQKEFTSEYKEGALHLNGKKIDVDLIRVSDTRYHLITGNRSVTIELVGKDETGKVLDLMINGEKKQVKITDEFDELLSKLGLDKLTTSKHNQIKAPMPGLVLRIAVKEGDVIKKGDPILVLEAMKMENVIKAPADAVVNKVNVNEKMAVEKNQVLVTLN